MTFPSCTTLDLDRDGDWLTVWLNRPAARNALMNRDGGRFFDVVAGIPQVLVVLVEGAAMAGGLGLLCAADVVAVARDATFAVSETSIGLVAAQIAPFLVQRMGLRVARRLMLTGERFDGTAAERIELAGETFAATLLSDEGREGIASFLAKRKPAWAAAPGARS